MSRIIQIDINDDKKCNEISVALSSKVRRDILRLLRKNSYTIVELAEILNTPVSTTAFNVNVLKKAELIYVTLKTHSRGNAKIVSRRIDSISFAMGLESSESEDRQKFFTVNIPLGSYVKAEVEAGCGIASEKSIIVSDDVPGIFYTPSRFKTQMLWFSKGFIEYNIPNYFVHSKNVKSISFSMEICSEAPNYRSDYLSDITFWINGHEVCTYVSPGDFGGRKGRLSPDWWSEFSTQYGILKTIKVGEKCSYLDEDSVSGVRLSHIEIDKNEYFTLRIGIKENTKNQGGLNLFGEKFGDHAQGLLMRVDYTDK